MKKIIIILGTIILGVLIVNNFILGDGGLKGSADSIQTKSTTEINKITNYGGAGGAGK